VPTNLMRRDACFSFSTYQIQARQMWQFASMLQFTDISFSSESALRGIVLIVHSLTNALVAYGRASSAPWVEFLPPTVSSTIDQMNCYSDDGIEAITAAAALKDNVLLIALNNCREAARNKARLNSSNNHSFCLLFYSHLPCRPVLKS
jgi:hypothetical protein